MFILATRTGVLKILFAAILEFRDYSDNFKRSAGNSRWSTFQELVTRGEPGIQDGRRSLSAEWIRGAAILLVKIEVSNHG